ncbi:GIY-YIG nuclease family protein [Leeuwenhoekiella parthenopeia]|uniref:GIY-YIG nuclease family protein n=1 Tax=Leeuwenhoekiella parthenopeia TaxID=2890320 RepID=A0ABS8GN85_9FLAO|nr:GIY-YIG nuclease family protein [Leeuwenhoekiella parthenopeia]MCC4211425.1 GIY-YIG nuclease family protein [Leeuwenhoekiella parthenopeia]
MAGYTYILECVNGSYYTGSTKNLEVRLKTISGRKRSSVYSQTYSG